MNEMQNLVKAREEYIDLIRRELLGPGSEVSIPDAEHELITTSPEKRYSIGILFPKNNKMNADNDDTERPDENADDEEDEATEMEDSGDKEEGGTFNRTDDDAYPEEANLDEEVSLAAQNMPSSMGIMFFVNGDTNTVQLSLKFATYRKALLEDCRIPFMVSAESGYVVPPELESYLFYDRNEGCLKMKMNFFRKDIRRLKESPGMDMIDQQIYDRMYKLADQLRNGYVRIPYEVNNLTIDFGKGDFVDSVRVHNECSLKVTALRRKMEDGSTAMTIMLVNSAEGHANGTNCIFQPGILVDSKQNNFVFMEYSGKADFNFLNEEEKSLELEYRNRLVYGTGLGTAIDWDIDGEGKGKIYNDFFPEAEVPPMDFNLPEDSDVEERTLSMKVMSDLDQTLKEEKIALLEKLVVAYEKWIDGLVIRTENLGEHLKTVAEKNIEGCRENCRRMKKGLGILRDNQNAWDAFQLANRAMFMQRVHLKLQEKYTATFPDESELTDFLQKINYRTIDSELKDRYAWRPFQLAFLLLGISGVTDDSSADREVVDLIWFPTGGGKTEAYLGLTAMTIFYRKLVYPGEADGTVVMMRYTLRLLAAQQFTRASTLICACEQIRQDSVSGRPEYGFYPLGKSEISIGLWIGREHTPNENKEARDRVKKLNDANAYNLFEVKERNNKFQVLRCPWCGTRMVPERNGNELRGKWGYQMRNNSRFEMFCTRYKCPFQKKLPIQIVDEELYKSPPTLLFGTVDKFAMFPWNTEIGNFFGNEKENRPPELIIQDELHLISGPLGTMVGLYESVIDALCRKNGHITKIVASTATIRRAREQCAALYDREVNQFPHPGLDAEDSFFARESKMNDEDVFGRKYVGLMPAGKTKAMMEIRTIAALLQKINSMDLPDDIKDKFWTLTAYFNSLKDLGKCSTMIDDDVKDFIKRMAFRLGTAKDARRISRADELTSRTTTTRLNETLDRLEKVCYTKDGPEKNQWPVNVLLATNMISVGIDVARLNVMLLVGQPKLTSEYIQASSRVGRKWPGVAFAMYDGSKSRDRSHYEQFRAYHESFYRHVEPTGATPFSKPARKRALHAIVIALLRLSEQELKGESCAGAFDRDTYQVRIKEIKGFILERSRNVMARLNPEMKDDTAAISDEIDKILEEWQRMAETTEDGKFFYGKRFLMKEPGADERRLMKAFESNPYDSAYPTMTSMRNVDTMVPGNILKWEEK